MKWKYHVSLIMKILFLDQIVGHCSTLVPKSFHLIVSHNPVRMSRETS